jgi:uracil-DNA glycosylase family 4
MSHQPATDCPLCPRLVAFRNANRDKNPTWHNAPVPSFGDLSSKILIVGLAPGLRGANATGRPFTGDWAGDLLYGSLLRNGLAEGRYGESKNDGLTLKNCRITNAVRCVPPANRPTTAEGHACRPFLAAEIAAMPNLAVLLAIGGFAHDAVLIAYAARKKDFPFAHGATHRLSGGMVMIDSYHCSRLNTNTGRLTEAMFDAVVAACREHAVEHDPMTVISVPAGNQGSQKKPTL